MIGVSTLNIQNVILITVDCLRYDHINYFNEIEIDTPNIDKFMHNGVIFQNAFANSASTKGSFPGIFFSKYLREAYDHENKKILNMPSVQGILKLKGYKTASVHSNPFISRFYGFDKDFTFFYDDLQPIFNVNSLDPIWRKIRNVYRRFITFQSTCANAYEINEIAKEWLENNLDQKYFLHIHYMDVHFGYFPKEIYFKRNFGQSLTLKNRLKILWLENQIQNDISKINTFSEDNRQMILSLYKSCVETVDEEFGKFLKFLEERDQLQQTLLIFTADHGQELGEHGYHMHGQLYDETIHIPLAISHPDITPQQIEAQVRLIDVPPTIQDCLGISIPHSYRGKSLYPLIDGQNNEDRVVISHNRAPRLKEPNIFISIRIRPWKFILSLDKRGEIKKKELYNIESDPKEVDNVAQNYPKITSLLLKDLTKNYIERIAPNYFLKHTS